jgi:hypothetical protein
MGQSQIVEHAEGFIPSPGESVGSGEEKIELIIGVVLPEALETEPNGCLIVFSSNSRGGSFPDIFLSPGQAHEKGNGQGENEDSLDHWI